MGIRAPRIYHERYGRNIFKDLIKVRCQDRAFLLKLEIYSVNRWTSCQTWPAVGKLMLLNH